MKDDKKNFDLGEVYITRGAKAEIDEDETSAALDRHAQGDWGDVCKTDWKLNDQALIHLTRSVSKYRSQTGRRFYIITEHDRSYTTILLVEEY